MTVVLSQIQKTDTYLNLGLGGHEKKLAPAEIASDQRISVLRVGESCRGGCWLDSISVAVPLGLKGRMWLDSSHFF